MAFVDAKQAIVATHFTRSRMITVAAAKQVIMLVSFEYTMCRFVDDLLLNSNYSSLQKEVTPGYSQYSYI